MVLTKPILNKNLSILHENNAEILEQLKPTGSSKESWKLIQILLTNGILPA